MESGLAGCNNPYDNAPLDVKNSENTPLRERVSVDSLESNLAKAVWRMVDATESAVETVEQYVNIPEADKFRAAYGAGLFSAQSIGAYLPNDLSTLKRQTGVEGARNAGSTAGETITL